MPTKPDIKVFETSLGWRYQILVAGHAIREDGNYMHEEDAQWAAETFIGTRMEGANVCNDDVARGAIKRHAAAN